MIVKKLTTHCDIKFKFYLLLPELFPASDMSVYNFRVSVWIGNKWCYRINEKTFARAYLENNDV